MANSKTVPASKIIRDDALKVAEAIVEYINSLAPGPIRLTYSKEGNYKQVFEFTATKAQISGSDVDKARFDAATYNVIIFPESQIANHHLINSIVTDDTSIVEFRKNHIVGVVCDCCMGLEIWDLTVPYPNGLPVVWESFCAPPPPELPPGPSVPPPDPQPEPEPTPGELITLKTRGCSYVPTISVPWKETCLTDEEIITRLGKDPCTYCPEDDPGCSDYPQVVRFPPGSCTNDPITT